MGEFAIKVSPFGGSTAEARRCGRMRACGGGDAYNYSFVVQTNSGRGYKRAVEHTVEAMMIGVKQCPSKPLGEVR